MTQFRHRDLDGRWNRLTKVKNIGIVLECRDPNSGLGWNPAEKPRYQYAIIGTRVMRRVLPPETVGDKWRDVGTPQWEAFQFDCPWEMLRKFVAWSMHTRPVGF
jgi:hypothetical protein